MFWFYFRHTLVFLLLLELLSLFAWFLPWFNSVLFIILILFIFIVAVMDLKWGLLAAGVELIIGSQGYLFSFNNAATLISLRMGIFMAVMLAWVIYVFKTSSWPGFWQQLKHFNLFKPYVLLLAVLCWGVLWGWLRGNNFGYLFLDFNNWLFFLYLLPLISYSASLKHQAEFKQQLAGVISAALLWLAFKTVLFLYIFSHQFIWALPELYKWIRDTRIGEITKLANNFYRIFIQSQIYALLGFLLLLPFIDKKATRLKKSQRYYFLLAVLLLATIIISFSRSFWLALSVSLVAYFIWLLIRQKSSFFVYLSNLFILFITASLLVFIIINLPPRLKGENLANLINQRTTRIEAAGSSRLSMLRPLLSAISRHPLLGSGFGSTVTYRSFDPRVLSATAGASGVYTTYAFEWSYLDLWLKLGLLGLLVYLWLLFKILQNLWHNFKSSPLRLGTGLALFALLVVNIFTPYLNHPLGIGFILWASLYSASNKTI